MTLSQVESKEREVDFTTENLFRAIFVIKIEDITFRETTIHLAESETLQNFCRLYKKSTIDYTLLSRAYRRFRIRRGL
ncbi:MAG: transposase [Planctomycetaceae bacterium]|nr:transposase [Planctomycetaceae bacterium]